MSEIKESFVFPLVIRLYSDCCESLVICIYNFNTIYSMGSVIRQCVVATIPEDRYECEVYSVHEETLG